KSNEWYLSFFLYKMRCLIQEVKPDLIICTHCFPSHLLNLLKENHLCEIPVINAYTDFFVNQAWGKHQIDYHFLPNQETKRRLHDEFGIHNHRMFVTGIPVHPEILKGSHKRAHTGRMKILIAGGNSGLGDLGSLLQQVKYCIHTDFYVLCGNNKKLFRDITSWHSDHITPIAYVSSRRVMNKLYEEMDALITKPGGVTISEAIEKRIPVFVHGALPGQEEINLKFLINQHLVFRFDTKKSLDEILANTLKNPIVMKEWNSALVTYQNDRIDAPQTFIAEFVQLLLEKGTF
ncbi:MGDG synthase family glycosyltransferase, partial [Exiguobacterium artemiae]|uniref:MGDG synthase family glycosyltransferase n=1 Tax=Exiguobacterium artemiae TaxID=340145 RepID=UPI0005544457